MSRAPSCRCCAAWRRCFVARRCTRPSSRSAGLSSTVARRCRRRWWLSCGGAGSSASRTARASSTATRTSHAHPRRRRGRLHVVWARSALRGRSSCTVRRWRRRRRRRRRRRQWQRRRSWRRGKCVLAAATRARSSRSSRAVWPTSGATYTRRCAAWGSTRWQSSRLRRMAPLTPRGGRRHARSPGGDGEAWRGAVMGEAGGGGRGRRAIRRP